MSALRCFAPGTLLHSTPCSTRKLGLCLWLCALMKILRSQGLVNLSYKFQYTVRFGCVYRCFPPRHRMSGTTPPKQEAGGRPSSYACSAQYSSGKQRRHPALWSPPTFGHSHTLRAKSPPSPHRSCAAVPCQLYTIYSADLGFSPTIHYASPALT